MNLSNARLPHSNPSNEDKKRDIPNKKAAKNEKESLVKSGNRVKAPMPGTIISLQIDLGDKVEKRRY